MSGVWGGLGKPGTQLGRAGGSRPAEQAGVNLNGGDAAFCNSLCTTQRQRAGSGGCATDPTVRQ